MLFVKFGILWSWCRARMWQQNPHTEYTQQGSARSSWETPVGAGKVSTCSQNLASHNRLPIHALVERRYETSLKDLSLQVATFLLVTFSWLFREFSCPHQPCEAQCLWRFVTLLLGKFTRTYPRNVAMPANSRRKKKIKSCLRSRLQKLWRKAGE